MSQPVPHRGAPNVAQTSRGALNGQLSVGAAATEDQQTRTLWFSITSNGPTPSTTRPGYVV